MITRRPSPRSDNSRAVTAALTLAGLATAVPLVLLGTLGWPFPISLTGPAGFLSHEGAALFGLRPVLATVAWAAWGQVLVCIVLQLHAAVKGVGPRLRLPLAGWVQPLVARLVAASAWMDLRPHSDTWPPRTPLAEVLRFASVDAMERRGGADPQPASHQAVTCSPDAARNHVVRRGDSLWDLAERHLGDPLRWRDLFELNRGRRQPDGGALVHPDRLTPGWVLAVAEDAPQGESVPHTKVV